MTEVMKLAEFVAAADYAMMSARAVEQLRVHLLDTIGVAIGALDAEPMVAIRGLLEDLGGAPRATLIGGGRTSPERAAFYNSGLSRYLDFMDSYLARGETNHPSDNLGAVLAAAESVEASGRELMTAFAVAYQVHTRLADVAPVRDRGFDHTTQGAFAAAAAAGKTLGLSTGQLANAMAIAGTANVALRVTRTGTLSHWKGLAYPHVSKEGTFAALLAARGITGPAEVFEGNKGFKDSVSGPFTIDWATEDLESVTRAIIKKHNAEIHSQSALDAAQEIRADPRCDVRAIRRVHLTTFDVAYSIIGGGEEGDKRLVRTKEEADHSLPWMLAAVLIDGELLPEQYAPERINAPDVQQLMKKIEIEPDSGFSARFPGEMPARLTVELEDGTALVSEKSAYHGFHTDPLDWGGAFKKYSALVTPFTGAELRDRIAEVIRTIEERPVTELTELLAAVPRIRTA